MGSLANDRLQRALLIADLDGTLLGNAAALREFAVWYARERSWLRLVYSSGRFVHSMCDSLREHGLPRPDALIGGVGTEIHELVSHAPPLNWPRIPATWNPATVRQSCLANPVIRPQPAELNSTYKLSFFARDLTGSALAQLRQQLQASGQEVSLVYSSNRDLDILPAGIDKGAAAAALVRTWGFAPARVIVAGDSGNDLSMFQRGFFGITVGNAHAELRTLRGANIFHAARPHAAGVLEGLRWWRTHVQASRLTDVLPKMDPCATRGRPG